MGTYKRLPRGKPKPHDDFKDWTMHAFGWIVANWKGALELVGLAAVAFAIVLGANQYWQSRSSSAAEALYAAEREAAGSDAQIAKLAELSKNYSRTPSGRQAMMMLGAIYLDRDENDKAAELFRTLAGRSRNQSIFEIAALHQLAESQLAAGDAAGAADTYLKAAADPGNIIALQSRYRAAAALDAAGDAVRAAAIYRQVIDDAKEEDRALRERCEERLLWFIASKRIAG